MARRKAGVEREEDEHLFAERKGLYWHMYDEAIDHHVPASPRTVKGV